MSFAIFSGTIQAQKSIAEPLHIEVTMQPEPVLRGQMGMGTSHSADGHSIDADSRCIYMDGIPQVPVSGELHYTRYPAEEWRDALLKMKAGGINIVTTYVFWIHHEERQGEWDWSGRRSLRNFIQLCDSVGLKVIVRMGPWSHGEVRNGGFPDWVQARPPELRRNQDPGFLELTEKLYGQVGQQLKGLLWKDGGPVIGIQLDNECGDLPYLFSLKKIARKCGIDVPLYTMTGWNGAPVPDEGLLPLFGGYADGCWEAGPNSFRSQYFFTPERNSLDMGAIGPITNSWFADISERLVRYPYVCCEIGGGMPSSYERRVFVTPDDCAALSLVKLGSGNNLPGYYMYQGGINPDGKYSFLNENQAVGNALDMPVKDYDFGAPLGRCGQLREHYFLFRKQHLFLEAWGDLLALMPAYFPSEKPSDIDDLDTVRWSVRSGGSRGFIFFNNHQRFHPLPEKEHVQFALKMAEGVCLVPQSPITLPAGGYGLWPVNMDCAGIDLAYATAQPLCRLDTMNEHWFFFAAIEGISPEFRFADEPEAIRDFRVGTDVAFTRSAPDTSTVHFVVLSDEEAGQVCKMTIAGQDRIIMSNGAVLRDDENHLRIETLGEEVPFFSILPPVVSAENTSGEALSALTDGVFQRFGGPAADLPVVDVTFDSVKKVDAGAVDRQPIDAVLEEAWGCAAVWTLNLPRDISDDYLLRINYTGDVARIYAGKNLIVDHFYNGQPFDAALWRVPENQRDDLKIRILPLRADRIYSLGDQALPSDGCLELTAVKAIPRHQWAVAVGGENESDH